jgi:hypothetical protein
MERSPFKEHENFRRWTAGLNGNSRHSGSFLHCNIGQTCQISNRSWKWRMKVENRRVNRTWNGTYPVLASAGRSRMRPDAGARRPNQLLGTEGAFKRTACSPRCQQLGGFGRFAQAYRRRKSRCRRCSHMCYRFLFLFLKLGLSQLYREGQVWVPWCVTTSERWGSAGLPKR